MTDTYSNYKKLKNSEEKGKDYYIEIIKRDNKYTIISPHGGEIEKGTTEIAKDIAANKKSYYSFVGNKKRKNFDNLHITSNKFDEPSGVQLVENSIKCLAIHGCKGKEEKIYVGGKDTKQKNKIIKALQDNGFEAEIDNRKRKKGISNKNICNRCKSNAGVQLELPKGFRQKLFKDLTREGRKIKTEKYKEFVDVIKNCLD